MIEKLHIEDKDVNLVLENKLKTTDYELLDCDLQQPDVKIGLLGDHAFLETQVRIQTKSEIQKFNFFVKYYPQHELSVAFEQDVNAFFKEAQINEKLFSLFDQTDHCLIYKSVPRCYLQRENDILIFEDLSKQGFSLLDLSKGCQFDVILLILKSLARLHACTLIYEEKRSNELGEPYRLTDEYNEVLQEAFYTKESQLAYASTIAAFKGVQSEIKFFEYPESLPSGRNFKAVVNKCCNDIFDLVKSSKKYRNVMCHGDLWFSNIFIKFSGAIPIDCKFVDFQLNRYSPPSHDVMSVIFLNTTKEFREKYLYELIGLYYNDLERHLKLAGLDLRNIIPFNDFLDSCEEQKGFAVIQSALYAQLIYLDNDVLTEFFSNVNLCKYALQKDKSILVLAHINKNEYYKNKLKDSIQSLWNYCQWF